MRSRRRADIKMALVISYLMDQLNITECTVTDAMIKDLMAKYGDGTELYVGVNKDEKTITVSIINNRGE